MNIWLPDPKKIDVLDADTETTGLGFTDVPVGFSFDLDGRQEYLAWGHQGGSNNITKEAFVRWLSDLRPGTVVYFHNAQYDAHMLANIGVDLIEQGVVVRDTQFMAAISNELEPSFKLDSLAGRKISLSKDDGAMYEWLAEKFGGPATRKKQAENIWRAPAHIVSDYAKWDAKLVRELRLYYERIMPDSDKEVLGLEWALIPTLHRMYEHGVRANVPVAQEHYERLTKATDELANRWYEMTGGVPLSGPGSRKGLMEAWEDAGLPFSTTPKGKDCPNCKGSPCSKHRGLTGDLLDSVDHPLANTLKSYREMDKIAGTFLKGYILDGAVGNRIHPKFHPLKTDEYGTVSGRFSSSDPNFQNLPSPGRDDKSLPLEQQYGKLIRSLILPEEGSDWLKLDYSQIEYRFFAHYAGGRIRDAYLNDPDVDFHQWCADQAGVPRSKAKNGNFAKLYGAGIRRLSRTLGVSQADAKRFVEEYNAAIPEADRLYRNVMAAAAKRGYIITWGGRKRRFRRKRGRFQATHAALNALLQGSAADLLKKAMVRVAELVDWDNTVLHLTVHDELDFSIPKGEKGLRFMRDVQHVMQDFQLSVPILSDAEIGPDWGHLKEVA